jgi:hypothetical protein
MIKFGAVLQTNGKGLWSRCATDVMVKSISVPYVNDEEDFGELQVHFDTDTWDIFKDGLIYTDSLFLSQLKAKLAECGFDATDVDYSEQGMQGDNYVSLDVGKKFLQSWFSVVDICGE